MPDETDLPRGAFDHEAAAADAALDARLDLAQAAVAALVAMPMPEHIAAVERDRVTLEAALAPLRAGDLATATSRRAHVALARLLLYASIGLQRIAIMRGELGPSSREGARAELLELDRYGDQVRRDALRRERDNHQPGGEPHA